MGHRDSGVGRHGQSGSHAGDFLKRNSVFLQQFQLLAASAEQEGVAALQTNHTLALQRLFQQDLIDAVLGHGMVAGLLAHVNFLSVFRYQAQNLWAHQTVKHDYFRPGNGLQSLPGQKARVTGACAH